MENKFILGIIPARGGSKGIKNKNIINISGKPLINYTIESARSSSMLSDVIVSTDSEVIASIAKEAGATIPFIRPSELATDEATTIDVIYHAVKEYENLFKLKVDIVVILQPTSPLRIHEDIDNAIKLFIDNPEFSSLISCYEANFIHPYYMYKKEGKKMIPFLDIELTGIRRQELNSVYIRNGALYISNRDLIIKQKKIVEGIPLGYIMPRERSINIDEKFDLEFAEFFIKRNKKK